MSESSQPSVDQGADPANEDRYPDLGRVVAEALKDPDLPDGPLERIEVTGLANGDGTYRVWPARSQDPIGGVILAS